MNVALVNTNRIKPPIAPIGLDYVAEALNAAGHSVEILDLCWEKDLDAAVAGFFGRSDYGLVGVTLRNTDDCAFTGGQSFVDAFAGIADRIRSHTDAPLVLGGVGFSVMPERVLDLCNADAGIWGEGEFVLAELADRVEREQDRSDLPGLIHRRDGEWHRNPPSIPPLESLPRMQRRWVDNPRYFHEGGQAGVETKRGCPCACIYCADPVAKGRLTRARPPVAVTDELEALLAQGIDHIHTCDSEFNIPEAHASAVCEKIVRRNLGDRLRWYAYCAPAPFSQDLARLMRRAGCVGINFGVDSGDAEMLKKLGRNYSPEDILNTTRVCREAGITVMYDLLFGGPGETPESIRNTIDLMKRADADRVGVAVGLRVYPGTPLAGMVTQDTLKAGLIEKADDPNFLFFVEPGVAQTIFEQLDVLIGNDKRFLFFDPTKPDQNYNYNANQVLVDAIKKGYRGAYWDILRRCEGTS